jgi:hypothetical protein
MLLTAKASSTVRLLQATPQLVRKLNMNLTTRMMVQDRMICGHQKFSGVKQLASVSAFDDNNNQCTGLRYQQ